MAPYIYLLVHVFRLDWWHPDRMNIIHDLLPYIDWLIVKRPQNTTIHLYTNPNIQHAPTYKQRVRLSTDTIYH